MQLAVGTGAHIADTEYNYSVQPYKSTWKPASSPAQAR